MCNFIKITLNCYLNPTEACQTNASKKKKTGIAGKTLING